MKKFELPPTGAANGESYVGEDKTCKHNATIKCTLWPQQLSNLIINKPNLICDRQLSGDKHAGENSTYKHGLFVWIQFTSKQLS